jgi:exonuclease I
MIDKYTFLVVRATGKDKHFSQIISIHARTVNAKTWEIIDELNEECCLRSYVLPSPEALIVDKLPLLKLRSGQSYFELSHKMLEYFSKHTPQVFISHNADFDFEMIQNAFYQNLTTSNLHLLKNSGNKLLCNFQLARTLEGFSERNTIGAITNLDNPTFNLESLCRENGIAIQFDDAKKDIIALNDLFRLQKEFDENIFRQTLRCSETKNSAAFINQNPVFFAAIGTNENFRVRPLTSLAISGNEVIVADLLNAFEDTEIFSDAYFFSLCGSEHSKDQAILKLPLNKGICFFDSSFQDRCTETNHLDPKILFRKASELKRSAFLTDLAIKNLGGYKEYENTEPEQLIYTEGLPNGSEKALIYSFNKATAKEKLAVLSNYRKKLGSKNRFIRLASRVMIENFPDLFSQHERDSYFNWYNDRLFRYPPDKKNPPWITFQAGLTEIDLLEGQYPSDLKKINQVKSFFFGEAMNGHSISDLLLQDSPGIEFVEKLNNEIRRRRR